MRLPTYHQVKKGIMSGATEDLKEFDVKDIGLQERKKFIREVELKKKKIIETKF